jgi:hypothetical protein
MKIVEINDATLEIFFDVSFCQKVFYIFRIKI